jgi:hypothetical protein
MTSGLEGGFPLPPEFVPIVRAISLVIPGIFLFSGLIDLFFGSGYRWKFNYSLSTPYKSDVKGDGCLTSFFSIAFISLLWQARPGKFDFLLLEICALIAIVIGLWIILNWLISYFRKNRVN